MEIHFLVKTKHDPVPTPEPTYSLGRKAGNEVVPGYWPPPHMALYAIGKELKPNMLDKAADGKENVTRMLS